ncbi:WD40 repeat domain-containing protein [Entomobacter blattae]|uniref:Lactonase, 7-bladed beta-propeller n=1 Tax=Entomobacter blattae TaxID=2762277 RepID=A0A7H1NSC3_9PROT|nr:beta-propeller fold lactonase family protein [Entomobacter blattae]QNT78683.1 Lactonase, 7-bladed beta-propeller [Entomobacter blattae]
MKKYKSKKPLMATALLAIAATFSFFSYKESHAQELVISAQDGKFQRVNGATTIPNPLVSDSLVVIDPSPTQPKVIAKLDAGFEQSIAGPPQSIALSPNHEFIIAGAASKVVDAKVVNNPILQLITFHNNTLTPVQSITLKSVVNGVAISPDNSLAVACGLDGILYVFHIHKNANTYTLEPLQPIPLSKGRLASAQFTPDGNWILVSRRDQGGIAVLSVKNGQVVATPTILSSGLAPYTMAISNNGHWAVVSNVGLAGLPDFNPKTSVGDVNSITLYDLSSFPFRAIEMDTTPSIPEGLDISEDGKWIAIQAMDGSFLPSNAKGHTKNGKVLLYYNQNGHLVKSSEIPSGTAGQGVAFADHGQKLYVQHNVEHQLAIYNRKGGKLVDSSQRISLSAGPVAIQSRP